MKRFLPRLLVSLVITAGLVWWVMNQGLPIIPARESFSSLRWWAVPGFLILLVLVHVFRAYRWRYLVEPISSIGMRKMMAVAFIGFLAILLFPLRMGEFARPWLLKKEGRVSMSAGFGTIAIERVVDGLLVSLWLTLALFAVDARSHEWVWWLRLGPLGFFTGSLAVLIALVIWPKPVRSLMGTISGWFGRRLQGFVLHVLDGFTEGIKMLPDRRCILGFTWWSVVYWGINTAAFWVLAEGCGMKLGYLGSIAAMGILAVGILLPAGVGLFGSFQASLVVALALFLPSDVINGSGSVFIFVNYAGQLIVTFGAGLWAMAVIPVSLWGVVDRSVRENEWEHVP